MKIRIILLIFVVGLLPILAQNSSGQNSGAAETKSLVVTGATNTANFRPTQVETQSTIEVFMQVEIRNANGQLIAYLEGPPDILDLASTLEWLEPQAKKSTIIKDGSAHDLWQFTQQFTFTLPDAPSAYFIQVPRDGDSNVIFWFNHDSIPVKPGDTFRVYWTIIG